MSELCQVDAAATSAMRHDPPGQWPARMQRRIKFKPQELAQYAAEILSESGPRAIRVRENSGDISVVFISRHEDVSRVLRDDRTFTLDHYQKRLDIMAPGGRLVLETDSRERDARYKIMRRASQVSPFFDPGHPALVETTRGCVRDLIDNFRQRPEPAFDMIGEYGFLAPHRISRRVFGASRSPDFDFLAWFVVWLKYNPLPLPFTPVTGSYLRQCTWAQLTFAQLFTNFENRNRVLKAVAKWAYPKLNDLIRRSMQDFGGDADADELSLLGALLRVRPDFATEHDDAAYSEHVLFIMLEIIGTAFVLPGVAFGNVIKQLAAQPGLLSQRLSLLTGETADNWVDESLRMAPAAAFVLRKTSVPVAFGNFAVGAGEYIAVLMGPAGADDRVVEKPAEFLLDRDPDLYLNSSVVGGPHRCFGRRVAVTMLGEMFRGLQQLPDLEPAGKLKTFFDAIPVHMPFRFSPRKVGRS